MGGGSRRQCRSRLRAARACVSILGGLLKNPAMGGGRKTQGPRPIGSAALDRGDAVRRPRRSFEQRITLPTGQGAKPCTNNSSSLRRLDETIPKWATILACQWSRRPQIGRGKPKFGRNKTRGGRNLPKNA